MYECNAYTWMCVWGHNNHCFLLRADSALLSQQEVSLLYDLDGFDRALPRLHKGTAADAWARILKSFYLLAKDHRLRRTFHSILQAYMTGSLAPRRGISSTPVPSSP